MSTCKTCRHWEPDHDEDAACGECHRNPPASNGWWPSMSNDYCGEWKAHPGALAELLEHVPEHNDDVRKAIIENMKRLDYVDRMTKEASPGLQWPKLEDVYKRVEEKYSIVCRNPWAGGENPKWLCSNFYEELRKMMGEPLKR